MFLMKGQFDTIAMEPIATPDRENQKKAATMVAYFAVLRIAAWFLATDD